MNGKLIGLLIRSNATVIEALKYANPGNGYEVHFDSLQSDCIHLAEEAEEFKDDVEIKQRITVAAKEGAQHAFDQLNQGIHPMIPISPAHQIKKEPLHVDYVQVGRKFMGRSEGNGQTYCAIITETDVTDGVMGRAKNVRTRMLIIDDKHVIPFERPLPWAQLTREFIRWEE